jgi:hypothetical protein
MNGSGMPRIEGKCAPCRLLSAPILAILFEPEGVHRKNAWVTKNRAFPFRHHLGDAISQHAPLAKAKIERMRNHKRENIARPIDQDGAITLDCESLVAVKPSTCRRRVTARRVACVWAL